MATINNFTYFGRLVRDPELRKTASGVSTATHILAQTEISFDSDGKKKERVNYVPITTYGRQAENDCKYLKKGSSIIVTGKIRSWYVQESGKSGFNFEASEVQYVGTPNRPDIGADAAAVNESPSYIDDWAREYEETQQAVEQQAARENRPVRQRQ